LKWPKNWQNNASQRSVPMNNKHLTRPGTPRPSLRVRYKRVCGLQTLEKLSMWLCLVHIGQSPVKTRLGLSLGHANSLSTEPCHLNLPLCHPHSPFHDPSCSANIHLRAPSHPAWEFGLHLGTPKTFGLSRTWYNGLAMPSLAAVRPMPTPCPPTTPSSALNVSGPNGTPL